MGRRCGAGRRKRSQRHARDSLFARFSSIWSLSSFRLFSTCAKRSGEKLAAIFTQRYLFSEPLCPYKPRMEDDRKGTVPRPRELKTQKARLLPFFFEPAS
ncbi:hypothetical protein HPB50_015379 [Hyalomma asiaticum]|uniref:Uncharacterized protein n=1 Tax=Hyalomma asiaticum TaxID=266040 RepID=A0ACB7T4T5_HYAAI|nr:hypothetical protein HPB50_015379 [Hyalomma asiaticum]